jgi:hypothetical protein
VEVPILYVDWCSNEQTGLFGLAPKQLRADFVDNAHEKPISPVSLQEQP